MAVRSGRGSVQQPIGSIYRVADFPKAKDTDWHYQPRGALTATKSKDKVAVNMGDFDIVCAPADKSWRYNVKDDASGLGCELIHTGNGFPTWYGKEKPQAYTPHCFAYGYFWAGTVEGTLTIAGRKVRIKGVGVRERYYAVDNCPAEVGGWHDWFWFHRSVCFAPNLPPVTVDRTPERRGRMWRLFLSAAAWHRYPRAHRIS